MPHSSDATLCAIVRTLRALRLHARILSAAPAGVGEAASLLALLGTAIKELEGLLEPFLGR